MLDKKYNHKIVEEGKYSKWLERGYFNSGDISKKPYAIVIPPPNVTGKLHLGHAWNTTLQDIMIRYKRMDGYDALWLPGMDHAGIATQARVDARLRDQGIDARSLPREEWLVHAWNWKEEYAESIRDQWAKLGLSLDYSKERFTLDEGLSSAVRHVFIELYNKGYIYRGERIINWDPEAMTALSNEEVIHKEVEGAFYHIKYMLEDNSGYLEVATTRPETLFGDTAVIVNPEDERYKHLIGKKVYLPIINKLIPILADNYADMEFGTGVVKVTPAHDPNDFEVGNRHNLERVVCMNPDGTMNENADKYAGMDRFECRKQLVEDLKNMDLLIKIEERIHSVGHSERTDAVVEPYLSKQWFVKMDELAKNTLKNQKTDGKIKFVPNRFEHIFIQWMENVHDWCISRQLWWGHQIPAWYKDEEIYVGETPPEGDGWVQDPDVLDTWFSSALWPFSTLNWPDNLDNRYFPNDVIVTGYDIIPFWICRMIFTSLEFTDQRPFNDCLIHGLIRDKEGRKMSKSLGNGVDPMDVIDEYGADSLRYFLTTNSGPGQDLRFDEEKVKATWNFINKLWNASRYVLMNIDGFTKEDYTLNNLSVADKWILSKAQKTIQKVRYHMDKYEFNGVGNEIYHFVWNDFCDWYIELSKFNQNKTTTSVLLTVLTDILKMLHPFMPYVTEEIYQKLPIKDETIVTSNYPVYNEEFIFEEEQKLEEIIDLIRSVRRVKLENNIDDYKLIYRSNDLTNGEIKLISKILKLDATNIISENTYNNTDKLSSIELLVASKIFKIYYDNSSNEKLELENMLKRKEFLITSINRREKLLANSNYVNKAPKNVVEEERNNLEKEIAELELINSKIDE